MADILNYYNPAVQGAPAGNVPAQTNQYNVPSEGEIFKIPSGEGTYQYGIRQGNNIYLLNYQDTVPKNPDGTMNWQGQTIGSWQTKANQQFLQQYGLNDTNVKLYNAADLYGLQQRGLTNFKIQEAGLNSFGGYYDQYKQATPTSTTTDLNAPATAQQTVTPTSGNQAPLPWTPTTTPTPAPNTAISTESLGTQATPIPVPATPTANGNADSLVAGAGQTVKGTDEYLKEITPPPSEKSTQYEKLIADYITDLPSKIGRAHV